MARTTDPPFQALADPTRRAVVELLGRGPLRAGALAAETGTSAPTMSRHLKVLLASGLVGEERDPTDARARIFHLRPESVAGLQAWIDQLGAHWDEQLRSYQGHVQRRSKR